MAEVRATSDTPRGYVPIAHRALATHLGCSPATARRMLASLEARQSRPDALRVVYLPVATGKGAHRSTRHVLWPAQGTP